MLRELEEGAEAGTVAAGPTGRPCMAGWPSSPDCSCRRGQAEGHRGRQGQKPGSQLLAFQLFSAEKGWGGHEGCGKISPW